MASSHSSQSSASRPSDRRLRNRRPQRADHRMQQTGDRTVRRRRLLIIITIGAVLLLAVAGIAIYGFYDKFIEPNRVLAARVGDTRYTQGDLVKRLRMEQAASVATGQPFDFGTTPLRTLLGMAEAEIIRRAAPEFNIHVSDADIQGGLLQRFGPSIPEGQEVRPGQPEQEFKENYRRFLTNTHLSDGDYRRIVEESIYRERIRESLGDQIPSIAEQVEVQWIMLTAPGAGGDLPAPGSSDPLTTNPESIRLRLENEDFTNVAREVSAFSNFADDDGYAGWVPKGAFPLLDPFLYGNNEVGPLELDEISEPIFTPGRIFILKVTAGPENREVSEIMVDKLKTESLENWLQEQKTIGGKEGWYEVNWNSKIYAWVNEQVRKTAPPPSPTPER